MDSVRHLICGAGISGLATAAFGKEKDLLVLERDQEIGGYCKTVKKDGFVWDYSGHFFHFKHPEIEAWLRERMPGQNIRSVEKKSFISYKGRLIDFPFQKNIHQLPQEELIECLVDLYFARTPGASLDASKASKDGKDSAAPKAAAPERNFKEMLYARFGRGIAEKFLIPYNEKLYACDLSELDKDAMGRFFPHADLTDIIRNMRAQDNASYNASFTYPEGGAIEYVKALASEVDAKKIALGETLLAVDLKTRIAKTNKREIKFERLISSMPANQLLRVCALTHDPRVFSWNKVLVFNLGFDKKGPKAINWIYYPDRARSFYRIGFYDNIFDTDRLSLYIELGYGRDEKVDAEAIEKAKARVLEDLRAEGVITDHKVVASHSVVMDPAYVHITSKSTAEMARFTRILNAHGVYSIGRYGAWTYCSIEDNIVEARRLVADFDAS